MHVHIEPSQAGIRVRIGRPLVRELPQLGWPKQQAAEQGNSSVYNAVGSMLSTMLKARSIVVEKVRTYKMYHNVKYKPCCGSREAGSRSRDLIARFERTDQGMRGAWTAGPRAACQQPTCGGAPGTSGHQGLLCTSRAVHQSGLAEIRLMRAKHEVAVGTALSTP
jgi:hypothetical protein